MASQALSARLTPSLDRCKGSNVKPCMKLQKTPAAKRPLKSTRVTAGGPGRPRTSASPAAGWLYVRIHCWPRMREAGRLALALLARAPGHGRESARGPAVDPPHRLQRWLLVACSMQDRRPTAFGAGHNDRQRHARERPRGQRPHRKQQQRLAPCCWSPDVRRVRGPPGPRVRPVEEDARKQAAKRLERVRPWAQAYSIVSIKEECVLSRKKQ